MRRQAPLVCPLEQDGQNFSNVAGKLLEGSLHEKHVILHDRSEADRALFENIIEDLVRESARPDREAFETLISQELLELDSPKFNHLCIQF